MSAQPAFGSGLSPAQQPRDLNIEVAEPQWSPLGRLTAPTTNPWAVLGEVLLLPLVAVCLGLWLNPEDPLWVNNHFPWAWLAPVILALRYGPLPGIGGACMLLLFWLLLAADPLEHFPKQVFLGGLILVMIIGEFASLWVARTRRAEGVQRYLDQRLEFLTHQYYLLRLSHDRLEQELFTRPMAMRDALAQMRSMVVGDHHDTDHACAAALLRLLAQYCQLETASLHPADANGIAAEPLATLGDTSALSADDPLIRRTLQTGQLCHISQSVAEDANPSRYLVASPLANLNGERFGVLVVERMPFFALQDETLQTINLLLGYYADSLSVQSLAAPIRERFPDCPPEFAFELQRLWHIRDISKVISSLVFLEIRRQPGMPDVAQQIQRQKRTLDENWLINDGERHFLITLMPISSPAAAEGYLNRLEYWAHQRSGKTLAELGVFGHVMPLDQEPLAVVQRIVDIVHA